MEKIEIDGEIVINAIAKKLNETFNTPTHIYDIYSNQVVGDLKEPCFFIHQLQVTQNKIRRNLWSFRFIMDVRYHSDKEISELNTELDNMGVSLLDVLENIQLQGIPIKVESDTLYYEKQNNILHTFVNYKFNGSKEVINNYMKNFKLEEGLKNV